MEAININSTYLTDNQISETSISDIPFSELLNDLFIQRCSKFYSFDDLVFNYNFKIKSKGAFLALPKADLDKYIYYFTSYNTWDEMFNDAVKAYYEKL